MNGNYIEHQKLMRVVAAHSSLQNCLMCHKFNHELNWFSQAVVTADVKGTAPKEQLKSLERNLDVALTQYWLRRGITQQHSKSWVVAKLKVWPKLIIRLRLL